MKKFIFFLILLHSFQAFGFNNLLRGMTRTQITKKVFKPIALAYSYSTIKKPYEALNYENSLVPYDLNKVEIKTFVQFLSKIDKSCIQIDDKNILKPENISQENKIVEKIILVDQHDNVVGHEEKMKAHENGGKLHRAFSIFIFNNKGEMLIQLRSIKKYHFGGLWTNTCCSHPNEGESLEDATYRKLNQEFGFNTDIKEKFSFIYKETDKSSGLTEHEFDHVFTGEFNGTLQPNPEEIDDFKWISIPDLQQDIKLHPEKYTPWFKISISKFEELGIKLQK